ncbi:MAG: glycosyltransferase [Cyanobacteria bacterium J06576_12]
MKEHLVKTWEQMSEQVYTFFYPGMAKWHEGNWLNTRDIEAQRLLEKIENITQASQIDLIFCVVYDDFFTPALCEKLGAFGIPLVNYHVDTDTQWYRCLRSARYFDLIGVAYKDYYEQLAALTDVIYLPMAANCDVYRPLNYVQKEIDVLFVGSYDIERERAMSAIAEVADSVVVYGSGWDRSVPIKARVTVKYPIEKYVNDFKYYLLPRIKVEGIGRIFRKRKINATEDFPPYSGKLGGYLADEAFVSVVNHSKIVVGINQRFGSIGDPNGCVSGRLRDFEVPACGATYLAQRYPELDVLFQEGRDIEGWSTLEELQYKITYYLNHEAEANALALNAREKVLRDHTWKHRFDLILKRLQRNTRIKKQTSELTYPKKHDRLAVLS